MTVVGLLHPGEMGAAVGAVLTERGVRVLWVPDGRSRESQERAQQAGLDAVASVADLAERSDIVLSIVPPHAARDVAEQVAGKVRVFVDANAVSPLTAVALSETIARGGGTFVDGGIVGPPPTAEGLTRLYLSGEHAHLVSALFDGTRLEAPVIAGGAGAASSLKMCYAAWTKGSDALLLSILATAREHGVHDELRSEWLRSKPELTARLYGAGWAAGRKGWRWVREMQEIATTFRSAGQPGGFHDGAAEVFRRSPHIPDAQRDEASLDAVVTHLQKG